MPIDTEEFRNRLKQMEGDLLGSVSRAEADAREAAPAEVMDETDQAVTDEERSLAMDQSQRDADTLEQVRDALERIENGTFGKCVICGRDIEPARLNAIPYTPYCKADAEAREPKFTPATL